MKGVTETIVCANSHVRGARFAIKSTETVFDIGKQPCILFLKGNEMHGTVTTTTGVGMVLISKQQTLCQYERGAYTNRTDRDDEQKKHHRMSPNIWSA